MICKFHTPIKHCIIVHKRDKFKHMQYDNTSMNNDSVSEYIVTVRKQEKKQFKPKYHFKAYKIFTPAFVTKMT